MTQVTEKKLCCGCTACENICPQKAISMKPDTLGFLYPEIEQSKCIDCGLCAKTCPVNNKSEIKNKIRNSYALINNDEKIRMESSSGGVFTLFAEKIINDGGVVFGAKFDSDFNVGHGYTETLEGIADFRGSKYVQSDMGNCFADCKRFLDDGRKVLFSGTPCQCAGLKAFLGKDYGNLTVIDLICHGVPSPALWQKYKIYREKKSCSAGSVVKTAFRCKQCGWKQYSLQFTFANCSEYCQPLGKDEYLQIFLHDTALRESCYQCFAKGKERYSDITLADFWGIEKVAPDFFDDKGTSLVCVNSERGIELFDMVRQQCKIKEVDADCAIGFNPPMVKSAIRTKKRDSFESDFWKNDIGQLYSKYGRDKLSKQMYRFIGKCCRKLLGDKGVQLVKKIMGKNSV